MCKSVNVLDTDKCNVQFTMYKVQIGCAVVFLDTDYTDYSVASPYPQKTDLHG